jgi:hypothetical protein
MLASLVRLVMVAFVPEMLAVSTVPVLPLTSFPTAMHMVTLGHETA